MGGVNPSFQELFAKQIHNQTKMLQTDLYDDYKSKGTESVPVDDVKLASYHVQQLMSEIGEVLDADKRWKNFRNDKCDRNAKVDELADCFIVLMNIAMFSGVDGHEMSEAIAKKMQVVSERIRGE